MRVIKNVILYLILIPILRKTQKQMKKLQNNSSSSENKFSLPLSIITGYTKNGHKMVFAYAGMSKTNLSLWKSIILENAEVEDIGTFQVNHIKKYLKKKHREVSVFLIEQSEEIKRIKNLGDAIVFPHYVQTYFDISKPMNSLPGKVKRYFSNTRRMISKYNLSYEMTDSVEAQKIFYNDMYLPYIGEKYKEICRIIRFEDVFTPFVPFSIILIKQDDKIITGGVVHYKRGHVCYAFLGVKNGNKEHTIKGGLAAIYYFLIQEMQKQGYNKLYLGGSPPILTHNLTRHKIRMAAKHDYDYKYKNDEFIGCYLFETTKAVREFLAKGPFIFKDKKQKMNGAIWIGKDQFSSQEEFVKNVKLLQSFCMEDNYILEIDKNPIPRSWYKYMPDNNFVRVKSNKLNKFLSK